MYGAVAAPDLRSAEAGAAMLRAGGNAVDAAVAAVFTSFVVEFSVVNPMGGGFATVVGPDGDAELLDFFLNAPGRPPFDGQDFRPVDVDWGENVQRFHVGRASAAVPGCVAGLCHLAARRGRLSLGEVLEPAIRHAREGFVVAPFAARALELLEEIFRSDPSCEAVFAPGGRLLRAGDRLVLDALGETFETLAREGPSLFETGAVARALLDDQARHGGRLVARDLKAYRPVLRPPLDLSFRDRRVLLPPPPSTGGRQVALALLLWERLVPAVGLSREEWGLLMAQVLRVAHEAEVLWERQGPIRLSGGVDTLRLHEDPRQRDRARMEGAGRILRYLGEVHVGHLAARIRRRMTGDEAPAPTVRRVEAGGTGHVSVLDDEGMAVSITSSAGESGGYVVGDTGLLMNNCLGEGDLHPDGFHLDPAGVRLRSRMCPTVILDGEEPCWVVGGGGSARLWPAVFQTVVALVDEGLSPGAAVGRPRLHFDGETLHVEGNLDRDERRAFEAAGFALRVWERRDAFFGGVQVVARGRGGVEGAGDPRRGGLCVTV